MKLKGKELSEETVIEACKAYGIRFEKPKFEPVRECCLKVSIESTAQAAGVIVIRSKHSGCENSGHAEPSIPYRLMERYDVDDAKGFIIKLQSAIDFIEKNKE